MKRQKTQKKRIVRRWTKAELKDLRNRIRRGDPARSIAKGLKRSIGAIYQRASSEGIRFPSR